MKLFNRAEPSTLETSPPDPDMAGAMEKASALLRCSLNLLFFLKEFALDIAELHPDRFKSDVDDLAEQFKTQTRPKRLEVDFERYKDKIHSFIEHQNNYLNDRELELRDIINLLTKAMANLNVENLEFYQRVYDQSEKMIEITRLDDIKRIKIALKQEVDRMRETVDLKRDQERKQLQLLAGQVDNLRRELETAKNKSMTDSLTGIYNRQAFDEYLTDLIERSQVMKSEFSLLMMDLDNFKAINDTHGHLIGDRVLVAFATKCRNAIRGDDFIARYGGEEFTIVLPGASLRNALKKARQICETVAAARYATNTGENGGHLSMTVSIGVSAYKKGDNSVTLIARADKALYDAKKRGKNRASMKK
ncbi:MAG: GGDEF domain-containing protein [Desulfosarcinaceae bacterium]